MAESVVLGWVCSVCGTQVDIGSPNVWTCPNAHREDRHHVLETKDSLVPLRSNKDPNPFVAFQRYLAWDAFANKIGVDKSTRTQIIRDLDTVIVKTHGVGFQFTPFFRSDSLSGELGFSERGGVWIKDETGNVANSHKSRHLFTTLLHLITLERVGLANWNTPAKRPKLAIASCGNAAVAATTLAQAVGWPIQVFVPEHANPIVLQALKSMNAEVVQCQRRDGADPGDPCVLAFRHAVAEGAIPFGVQGPENTWCLDGGRTIGWEMAVVAESLPGPLFSRMFIQVGGGALITCAARGFFAGGTKPQTYGVQTSSCAPLKRAFDLAQLSGGAYNAGGRWQQCMWPWEQVAPSIADGILDDETYDWIGACNAMSQSDGLPIIVSEALVETAFDLARNLTKVNVSPTGSAGLAGLLATRDQIDPDERSIVIFSGINPN